MGFTIVFIQSMVLPLGEKTAGIAHIQVIVAAVLSMCKDTEFSSSNTCLKVAEVEEPHKIVLHHYR